MKLHTTENHLFPYQMNKCEFMGGLNMARKYMYILHKVNFFELQEISKED